MSATFPGKTTKTCRVENLAPSTISAMAQNFCQLCPCRKVSAQILTGFFKDCRGIVTQNYSSKCTQVQELLRLRILLSQLLRFLINKNHELDWKRAISSRSFGLLQSYRTKTLLQSASYVTPRKRLFCSLFLVFHFLFIQFIVSLFLLCQI